MDLTGALLRAGGRRPHVLIVTMPGGTAVRVAAEQQLRRRGWPAAMTPADADVLLIAGLPSPGFGAALEQTWQAMPAPRARGSATRAVQVSATLETARRELADQAAQRKLAGDSETEVGGDAPGQAERGSSRATHGAHGHTAAAGEARDMNMSGGQRMGERPEGREAGGGSPSPASPAHTDHDGERGADPGEDMAGMDMSGMDMPAGLPMAQRGDDRDGLKLDQLHVPFGPLLPHWPAGLIVHLTLQGDVIQRAEVEVLDQAPGASSFWCEPWRRAAAGELMTTREGARRRVAAHLDSLSRLLAVAGWDDASTSACRLRDDALDDIPPAALRPALHHLTARIAASRSLAWSTRGLGSLSRETAVAVGVRGPALRACGDVTDRYRRWCTELVEVASMLDDGSPLDSIALEPPRGSLDGGAASVSLLAALPGLLDGVELAAARIIIASLDPDLDELAAEVVSTPSGC